jgi:hypothetical protein
MAYKFKKDQALASNKHYHKNKEIIIAKNVQRVKDTAEFIASLKKKPCADCKKTYPPYVMDFDHVRGKKVRAIASARSWSKKRIMEEVEKCDLVCSNCHRIRTWKK